MTLDDASILIFKHFIDRHSFSFEEDFQSLVPVAIDEPVERGVIEEALKRYEAEGIVCKILVDERPVWNLTRPLEAYGKDLRISSAVADGICDIVNERSKLAGSDYRCNPLNLNETDLIRLAYFASMPSRPVKRNQERVPYIV